MKIAIHSALILDKKSPFHKKKKNVLIQNGKIESIGDKKFTADIIIDGRGLILSAGWFDLGAFVGDPGNEQKEDLDSLAKAAAAGGFTDVAVLPNTQPSVQTKNEITYLTGKNNSRLVQVHAMASVTRNNEGEELTEMIDLHEAGAVAFTDGLKPVWHTDIFLKTLQYLRKFDGLLVDHAEDHWLNLFGQMNEGVVSTSLGLKGMPMLAEEVTAARNIQLVKYSGGRLHLSRVSSPRVLALVRQAKKEGLPVSCDVATYQPLLDDSALTDFDTNFKVNPPLRERTDNKDIIKAIKDGTIDVLCSGHTPQEEEVKAVEFDHAEFGITNLQTMASQLAVLSKSIDLADLIEKVTRAPRELLKLEVPFVRSGGRACLTLFNPKKEWIFNEKTNFSKSKNSPWLGRKLKGKVAAVFNNSKHWVDG